MWERYFVVFHIMSGKLNLDHIQTRSFPLDQNSSFQTGCGLIIISISVQKSHSIEQQLAVK